ncbi:MAG TPA: amino acid permease [Gemmatimonadaceae bacterium]|nr:amino acid permease [Gemmatimonadaceae bacterium]
MSEAQLERALGPRALAATIFNVTIGGGIFVLPAVVALGVGAAAPLAYVICAAAMGLIVLCFAEAGSRVSLTGGPYAYVESVFGPYVGFLAGVLLWLLGCFATASVASAFAGSVGALVPALAGAVPRGVVLVLLMAVLAAVNVSGVRRGTRLIEVVTVAKLVPLLLFVAVGAYFVSGANLHIADMPSSADLGRTCVLLVFAFAGVESALVPSGEVKDPARTVPRALFVAMIGVTLLYIGIQVVAQGILGPELATSTAAPLAAAAEAAVGRGGALLLLGGAVISMFGFVSGMTLATPRALYAFGRDGILPQAFARIHPAYHTPYVAIAVQSAIVCGLAVQGSFARLAILANVSTLLLYLLCCVAAWELRRRDVRTGGGVPFRVPGGAVVPVLACLVILWLLSNATLAEFGLVAAVLAAASVLFALTRRKGRTAGGGGGVRVGGEGVGVPPQPRG